MSCGSINPCNTLSVIEVYDDASDSAISLRRPEKIDMLIRTIHFFSLYVCRNPQNILHFTPSQTCYNQLDFSGKQLQRVECLFTYINHCLLPDAFFTSE